MYQKNKNIANCGIMSYSGGPQTMEGGALGKCSPVLGLFLSIP